MQQIQTDANMIATFEAKPRVYEGHPFIVEAGVSIGGDDSVSTGVTVHRFANRIPMLFEGGADVVTRIANKHINWASYKIKPNADKIGVFVSISSTKIPFKGTSKEYIGEDAVPIAECVKHALMKCANELKGKIAKANAAKEKKDRKRNLTKYVEDVSRSIFNVVFSISQDSAKRQRTGLKGADMLENVQAKQVTKANFEAELHKHINKVDYECGLEYAAQHGSKKTEEFFIQPLSPSACTTMMSHQNFSISMTG